MLNKEAKRQKKRGFTHKAKSCNNKYKNNMVFELQQTTTEFFNKTCNLSL